MKKGGGITVLDSLGFLWIKRAFFRLHSGPFLGAALAEWDFLGITIWPYLHLPVTSMPESPSLGVASCFDL